MGQEPGESLKKRLEQFSVLALIALLAGCGGGGGGGGGSNPTTTYTGYQVTLVVASNPSQMVDAGTLFVGDSIQLEITARDKKGNLVTIPVSGWNTTAPSSVATISSSGLLTAVGVSGGSSYTVSVNVGGKIFQTPISIVTKQNVVTGFVRNTSNAGIQNVGVAFYDSTKKELVQTKTTRDGTFRVSVPSSATRFTIDMGVSDPNSTYYYSQYFYNSNEFLEGSVCLAPIGITLSSTAVVPMASDIIPDLRSFGPPPPPTGCIGP